jgi:hypothetical protein
VSWFPSAKTVSQFVIDVFRLQRTAADLREKNQELQQQLLRLQRPVDEQAGQIAVIRGFIGSAVNETAARSGEQAAIRAIRAMLFDDKRD